MLGLCTWSNSSRMTGLMLLQPFYWLYDCFKSIFVTAFICACLLSTTIISTISGMIYVCCLFLQKQTQTQHVFYTYVNVHLNEWCACYCTYLLACTQVDFLDAT
jgi:hypothetical protein